MTTSKYLKQYSSLFKQIKVLGKSLKPRPAQSPKKRKVKLGQLKKKNTETTSKKLKSYKTRMTEFEMQKKNRASHKSVATKYWTEAESLILPTRIVTITDAVIQLEQLHKNFSKKQTFLNDLNQQIQAKFDTEEFDDKLVQQLDQIDRFIRSNTPTVRGTTSATTTRGTPPLTTAKYLNWICQCFQ